MSSIMDFVLKSDMATFNDDYIATPLMNVEFSNDIVQE